jgi:hypothetical protein
MPRVARQAPGGYVYHVLNRGVGRMQLFSKPADYEAFERVLAETLAKIPLAICGYCLMPQSLAFRGAAGSGGGTGSLFPAINRDARHAVAAESQARRLWTCLSRPLQVIPRRGRPTFLSGDAIHRAESVSRKSSCRRLRLAMVQLMDSRSWNCRTESDAGNLATALPAQLERAGERTPDGVGIGGTA